MERPNDPGPLEDKARRRIAYLLIALLALMIVALLAGVVFGIIPVSEIEEFDVILGPLVALVSAATGFYYASKGELAAAEQIEVPVRGDLITKDARPSCRASRARALPLWRSKRNQPQSPTTMHGSRRS